MHELSRRNYNVLTPGSFNPLHSAGFVTREDTPDIFHNSNEVSAWEHRKNVRGAKS